MSKEIFIPPQIIYTDRLVIRPFQSADDEREYRPWEGLQDDISAKEKAGYYGNNDSPFKEYGIFLHDSNQLIGDLQFYEGAETLESEKKVIASVHNRRLDPEYKSKGFGTEITKAIINQLVKPALGKMVLTSACEYSSPLGKYIQKNIEPILYHGHYSGVGMSNHESICSNLKAGMGVGVFTDLKFSDPRCPDYYDTNARMKSVIMIYPPEADGPDSEKMLSMFKAITAYNKEKSPEQQTILKTILIDIILTTQDPHVVIEAAHTLLSKCNENPCSSEAIKARLKEMYEFLAEHSSGELNEDGSNNSFQNGNFYNAENDSVFREIFCSGEATET